MSFGFDGAVRAVVTGARGGVGEALVRRILDGRPDSHVWVVSREPGWVPANVDLGRVTPVTADLTRDEDVAALAEAVDAPNLVIGAHGLLHRGDHGPERTWRHIDAAWMAEVFAVDAIAAGLLIKHLIPVLPRKARSVFAMLSARVGSIGDNRLGGWYSYRAAKAAQNMLVKTASIEAGRRAKQLICLSLHPGTVDTALSSPFSARVPPEKLFTPEFSAERLEEVITGRTPTDSGGFFAWDGQPVVW